MANTRTKKADVDASVEKKQLRKQLQRRLHASLLWMILSYVSL